MPASEQEQVIGRMNAFGDQLKAAGKFVSCGGLAPAADAKTVRLEGGGHVVTDGPALPLNESKDLVTGFFVVETSSIEEAVQWAKKMPIIGGSIEIRHIAQEWGQVVWHPLARRGVSCGVALALPVGSFQPHNHTLLLSTAC